MVTYLLLALVGCGRFPAMAGDAPVVVDLGSERVVPESASLDFGTVSATAGVIGYQELVVTNPGDDDVLMSGQATALDDAAFWIDADTLVRVPAHGSVTLPIYFAPATETLADVVVTLEPGDATVELHGHGTAPVASIEPLDFGSIHQGCSGEATALVRNSGTEPLELKSVTTTMPDAAVVDWPSEIPAGGTGIVTVQYAPSTEGSVSGELSLVSNDPASPFVSSTISGVGDDAGVSTDRFTYATHDPTDILILADNDANLDDYVGRAVDQGEAFVGALRDADLDYRILGATGEGVCASMENGSWASRNDPESDGVDAWNDAFEGGNGGFDRDLIGLAVEALDESGPDGCLDGFRRSDADLDLVIVSARTGAMDVNSRIKALRDSLTFPATLQISSIVSTSGCAPRALDYETAAHMTGGTVEDLCAADWTSGVVELLDNLLPTHAITYTLTGTPVPATLQVAIDGVSTDLWTYDAARNTITYTGDAPSLGTELEVSYVSESACDE